MGGNEVSAGGGAGVVWADGAVDVSGVEWDVGALRFAWLAGADGGCVEGELGGVGGCRCRCGVFWAIAAMAGRRARRRRVCAMGRCTTM